jgi:hypothetical protein
MERWLMTYSVDMLLANMHDTVVNSTGSVAAISVHWLLSVQLVVPPLLRKSLMLVVHRHVWTYAFP